MIARLEFVTVYHVAATIALLQKSRQDLRRISRRVASIGVYAFPVKRAVLKRCRTRRSGPQTLGAPIWHKSWAIGGWIEFWGRNAYLLPPFAAARSDDTKPNDAHPMPSANRRSHQSSAARRAEIKPSHGQEALRRAESASALGQSSWRSEWRGSLHCTEQAHRRGPRTPRARAIVAKNPRFRRDTGSWSPSGRTGMTLLCQRTGRYPERSRKVVASAPITVVPRP
jgi:hypothetical protein